MTPRRIRSSAGTVVAVAGALIAAAIAPARAGDFPDRPVRFVVEFPASTAPQHDFRR